MQTSIILLCIIKFCFLCIKAVLRFPNLRGMPSEINDAHACGIVNVALQATRMCRDGSHGEP